MRSGLKNFVRHIIPILLVALMAASILPICIAAEGELTDVTITGLAAPRAGDDPDRTFEAAEEGVSVTGVKWYYSTTPNYNTFREISGKFGSVPYYSVEFTLAAAEGTTFAPGCRVVIDGIGDVLADNMQRTADGKLLAALYVFDKVTADVVTKVTVDGFVTPQPGREPCGIDALHVSGGMEADQLLWNEAGNFEPLAPGTVFEKGKTYEATLWLKTVGENRIGSDTAFSVGALSATCEYRDEGTLCLKLTLVCAEAEDTILSMELLKEPDKVTYTQGEEISLRGMVVYLLTAAGEREIADGEGMEFSPKTIEETGTHTVTVTFGEKELTFDVMVLPRSLGTVTSIEITELREPEAGKKAKNTFTSVSVPSEATDCRLGWYWFSDEFEYVPFSGTFEAGGRYAAYIFVTPLEGYDLSGDAIYTVNGVRCVQKEDENGNLILIRYFDELPPADPTGDEEIGEIDVRGVVMPERGRYPDLSGVSLAQGALAQGAPMTILECVYVSESGGVWTPYTSPFALGHYGIRLVLHASDGYVFDEPTALLNGAAAKAEVSASGKTATVIFDLIEIHPGTDPLATEPVVPQTSPSDPTVQTLPLVTDPVSDPAPSSRFPVFPLILCILLALALAAALFFLFRAYREPKD